MAQHLDQLADLVRESGSPDWGNIPFSSALDEIAALHHRKSVDPFSSALDEIAALHHRKSVDYGTPGDPYSNVRGSADWGIQPWVGALVRATDKLRRLQRAAQGSALVNEGIEDSLLDLATYAVIALLLWRERTQ